MKEDGFLVFSDTYYPGWRAFIDELETPVMRSNYTFQAIAVPKGNHSIEIKYQPESFKNGLTISLATLISLIIATFFSKKRHI